MSPNKLSFWDISTSAINTIPLFSLLSKASLNPSSSDSSLLLLASQTHIPSRVLGSCRLWAADSPLGIFTTEFSRPSLHSTNAKLKEASVPRTWHLSVQMPAYRIYYKAGQRGLMNNPSYQEKLSGCNTYSYPGLEG